MVGYAHLMKGDFFGVLEETVWSPDLVEPLHVEDPILFMHVLRKTQPRVSPGLSEEYVRYVRL